MENQNVNALATINEVEENGFVGEITKRTQSYCSVTATTTAEKAELFNAMNAPQKRVAECINEVIAVKDIFVETVSLTNRETGEVQECPRIVLIDDKKVAYQAVSLGLFGGLKKLFSIYGLPTEWTEPVKIKVKQITKGEKKILSFEIVNK